MADLASVWGTPGTVVKDMASPILPLYLYREDMSLLTLASAPGVWWHGAVGVAPPFRSIQ